MSNIMRDGEIVTYDRDGNVVKSRFAKDGERISVSMLMLDHGRTPAPATPTFDASQHQPHALPRTTVDDARSLSARQAYINRLNDGWKQPASTEVDDRRRKEVESEEEANKRKAKKTATREEADAAYDRYRQRLEDGWKNAKSVA